MVIGGGLGYLRSGQKEGEKQKDGSFTEAKERWGLMSHLCVQNYEE